VQYVLHGVTVADLAEKAPQICGGENFSGEVLSGKEQAVLRYSAVSHFFVIVLKYTKRDLEKKATKNIDFTI